MRSITGKKRAQPNRHPSTSRTWTKPSGSIRIRVETIDYFLRRYREEVIRKRKAAEEIDAQLAELEGGLRGPMASRPVQLLQIVEELNKVFKREEQLRHDFRHAMKATKLSGGIRG
jgi:hypothetical protein